jgi:hypothetical protein
MNLQEIHAGSLIAFSGVSLVSDLINLVTFGQWRQGITHVGIMGYTDEQRLLLFESTTLDKMPDELLGKPVNGTQVHELSKVIESYEGKIWLYPLVQELTPNQNVDLTQFLMATLHVPYDEQGAMRSAWLGLPGIPDYTHKDLKRIFCSEWIMAAYEQISVYKTLNASSWNPNRCIKQLRKDNIITKPIRLK